MKCAREKMQRYPEFGYAEKPTGGVTERGEGWMENPLLNEKCCGKVLMFQKNDHKIVAEWKTASRKCLYIHLNINRN